MHRKRRREDRGAGADEVGESFFSDREVVGGADLGAIDREVAVRSSPLPLGEGANQAADLISNINSISPYYPHYVSDQAQMDYLDEGQIVGGD